MKREETIRLTGLSIGYRGKHSVKCVADGISQAIHSGELTCLLGENGAGKSTLLRTLSGFLSPLAGEISILGRPLSSYKERELATVIGVVLTEKNNLQNMTVRELVGMGRSPYTGFWGRLSADDRRKVDDALSLVGIAALSDRMVQTLSDGERQKVMIAKALAQETPIIFLDEPTAFLDYPSKVEILHLLHRLSREMHKTIFLSTHDLELALQIADRLWLMPHRSDPEKRGSAGGPAGGSAGGQEVGHGGGRSVTVGTPEDLSLDGTLDMFFRRKGVAFEKQTGLYRIEPEYRAEVRLTGDPVACEMVRKALRRNGIRALSAAAPAAAAADASFAAAAAAPYPAAADSAAAAAAPYPAAADSAAAAAAPCPAAADSAAAAAAPYPAAADSAAAAAAPYPAATDSTAAAATPVPVIRAEIAPDGTPSFTVMNISAGSSDARQNLFEASEGARPQKNLPLHQANPQPAVSSTVHLTVHTIADLLDLL